MLQRNERGNEGQEAQIRKRVRKAAEVIGEVWGIDRRGLGRTGGKESGCLINWYGQYWDIEWRYGDKKRGRGWRG